ncbi:MAG TPA: ankyrin repeat domain-containing protein [Pseudonocardiaceae bacterium]
MSHTPFRTDLAYHEDRAAGLLESALDGTPGAVAAFDGLPFTPDGARAALARAHGAASWAEFVIMLGALAPTPFARAFRAVEAHDLDGLAAVLAAEPELVRRRGTNGNDLIGLAAATCDERTVRLLLDAGAPADSANVHGWTPLHQAGYADLPLLARLLLDAGAPLDVSARGDGGTPLVVALFWGNVRVAGLLTAGPHPDNLRVAAGLGWLDRLCELLADPAAAGAHRGFYRPHGGFPRWRPSGDPAEVLDEALSWAARNDRADAVTELVAAGARVDADVYRGTALGWAAATGALDTVRRLLRLGADPNARGTFGGPDHGVGVTALHLAAQHGHAAVADELLAAGADPMIRDDRHGGTAAGWAHHGGHPALAERLDS